MVCLRYIKKFFFSNNQTRLIIFKPVCWAQCWNHLHTERELKGCVIIKKSFRKAESERNQCSDSAKEFSGIKIQNNKKIKKPTTTNFLKNKKSEKMAMMTKCHVSIYLLKWFIKLNRSDKLSRSWQVSSPFYKIDSSVYIWHIAILRDRNYYAYYFTRFFDHEKEKYA